MAVDAPLVVGHQDIGRLLGEDWRPTAGPPPRRAPGKSRRPRPRRCPSPGSPGAGTRSTFRRAAAARQLALPAVAQRSARWDHPGPVEAPLAPGGGDQYHPVPLRRRPRHGPPGEQRFVVGMGMEEHRRRHGRPLFGKGSGWRWSPNISAGTLPDHSSRSVQSGCLSRWRSSQTASSPSMSSSSAIRTGARPPRRPARPTWASNSGPNRSRMLPTTDLVLGGEGATGPVAHRVGQPPDPLEVGRGWPRSGTASRTGPTAPGRRACTACTGRRTRRRGTGRRPAATAVMSACRRRRCSRAEPRPLPMAAMSS